MEQGLEGQWNRVLKGWYWLDCYSSSLAEFLQLESDAQTEMKEIEEMLSLFGSDEAVGGGDSPLKRCSLLTTYP